MEDPCLCDLTIETECMGSYNLGFAENVTLVSCDKRMWILVYIIKKGIKSMVLIMNGRPGAPFTNRD